MGGRGAKMSRRTNPYSKRPVTVKAGGQTVQGGGGGAGTEAGADGAGTVSFNELGDVSKLEVVSMTWSGRTHKAANDKNGSITIKDEFGNLHTSKLSSAGSARITYEFKDFVLKFENFHSSENPGQNATEIRAYNNLSKADKAHVPRPLGDNKTVTMLYNGKTRTGQMIAIERATALDRKLTREEYDTAVSSLNSFARRNGVTDMSPPAFNSPDAFYGKVNVGHNTMFVSNGRGGVTFKALDIPDLGVARRAARSGKVNAVKLKTATRIR